MDATWSKTTAALGGRGQILLAASVVLLVLTAATPVPARLSHAVLGVYQSYTRTSGPLQAIGDRHAAYAFGTITAANGTASRSQSDINVPFSDEAPGNFGSAVFTDY